MAVRARPRWVAVRRCMTDFSSTSVASTTVWTPGRGVPWATASTPRALRGRPSPLSRRTDRSVNPRQSIGHACGRVLRAARATDQLSCAINVARSYGVTASAGSFRPLACEWAGFRVRSARDPAGSRRRRRRPRRTRPLTVPSGTPVSCGDLVVGWARRRTPARWRIAAPEEALSAPCSQAACVLCDGSPVRAARATPSPRSRRSGLRCPGGRVRR